MLNSKKYKIILFFTLFGTTAQANVESSQRTFITVLNQMSDDFLGHGTNLFLILASLELVYLMIKLSFDDISSLFKGFFLWFVKTLIFFILLTSFNSKSKVSQTALGGKSFPLYVKFKIDSLFQRTKNSTSSLQRADPRSVSRAFNSVLRAQEKVKKASTLGNFGIEATVVGVFVIVLFSLAGLGLVLIAAIAFLEASIFYIYSLVGCFILGLAGLGKFQGSVANYITSIIAHGIKVLVLYIIAALAYNYFIYVVVYDINSTGATIGLGLEALFSLMFFTLLAFKAPDKIAQSFGASAGGAGFMSSVSNMVVKAYQMPIAQSQSFGTSGSSGVGGGASGGGRFRANSLSDIINKGGYAAGKIAFSPIGRIIKGRQTKVTPKGK